MTKAPYTLRDLEDFLEESLMIEGIERKPTEYELAEAEKFLKVKELDIEIIKRIQAVFTPGKPLRTEHGMNVRVGQYYPPAGGKHIYFNLLTIIDDVNTDHLSPWALHCRFEALHPFMDGNGRTGRILWAWHMIHTGHDPFDLKFLHRWYYQTLQNARV